MKNDFKAKTELKVTLNADDSVSYDSGDKFLKSSSSWFFGRRFLENES